MTAPDTHLPPAPPPPHPYVEIDLAESNVSLITGQSSTVPFSVSGFGEVTLSVDALPQGVTAAFDPEEMSFGEFSSARPVTLTLTAASDAVLGKAAIRVTASVGGGLPDSASVSINTQAVGQVRPSYLLLNVVYAPPGTNGGRSSSQVVYGSGSTTGTTDSTSNSFKAGVDVTASAGFNIGVVNLGVSADFTASQTSGDTSSISINKNPSNQITVPGPAEDGINHGHDMFYLWLNPLLNVTMDGEGTIAWAIAVDGPDMDIQYVYAEQLQDPSKLSPGVAKKLADAGLTKADYAQILACYPFSSGNPAIDPNRFVPTMHSFPYEPPLTAADPVPTMTYTQTSATTATNSQQVQNQYGVSASVSAGIQAFYNAQLKVTGSLQWTNTSTSTQTTGSSQSASVTVGGPAFGYTGPTDVLVYWDTVFSSFMFAFATETPAASGTLTDTAGNPIPYKALTLSTGERTLSTFTDARGEYRFYGAAQGQGTISVDRQEFAVTLAPHQPSTTLRVTT
jgi:hypothetical protein